MRIVLQGFLCATLFWSHRHQSYVETANTQESFYFLSLSNFVSRLPSRLKSVADVSISACPLAPYWRKSEEKNKPLLFSRWNCSNLSLKDGFWEDDKISKQWKNSSMSLVYSKSPGCTTLGTLYSVDLTVRMERRYSPEMRWAALPFGHSHSFHNRTTK